MSDASRVPPSGFPEPDPLVRLVEIQLARLHGQLRELAVTVALLEPPARRAEVATVVAAVDHNLNEAARRLRAKDPEQ